MWTRIACGVFSLPKKGWGGRRVETCSRSCLLIIQILTTPFPSSPAPLSPQLTPSFIYIWLILYLTLLLLFPCTCQSKIMMVIIEMMITIISAWSLLFMDVSVASRDHWWITEWQERERERRDARSRRLLFPGICLSYKRQKITTTRSSSRSSVITFLKRKRHSPSSY